MRRTLTKIVLLMFLLFNVCGALGGAAPSNGLTLDEVVAPLNELCPGQGGGGQGVSSVEFQIGHECTFGGFPRPWILGVATLWDSSGRAFSTNFMHQQGYEIARFDTISVGIARGEARIIVGFGPCTSCSTGMHIFTVEPTRLNVVPMTMKR